MRRTVSTPACEAPLRPVPLSMIPDMEVRVVPPPRSPPTAFRARSTSQLPTEGDDSGGGARVDANQERPISPMTPPSRGGPVAVEAIRDDVLQNEHEGPDQVALASDTDDGGGGSSDESFNYDYSDGGPVSEPEEEGLEEALVVHTAVPAVRRPYTKVNCGRTRDSVRLGRYDHTRRPYAGPDMLVVQIEEHRAELAFLRAMWPQGPTQPAGVAPEMTARTDDEALGEVGSQGLGQAPMADIDTAGAVECEVQAGASDAEGCGMGASDDFEVFERTAALENTEDGTAGMREESASSGVDGCGAQPDDTLSVAGGATARTGDEMLGEMGSPGVAQAPMADTDTAGTVECGVHAGTSSAEGRGMDASDGFEVFATRSEPVPGAVGWSATGPEWRP